MARQENPKFKPSIEFYVDGAMGLCVVKTKRDGSQGTRQYLSSAEAQQWLADWLTTPEARNAIGNKEGAVT